MFIKCHLFRVVAVSAERLTMSSDLSDERFAFFFEAPDLLDLKSINCFQQIVFPQFGPIIYSLFSAILEVLYSFEMHI